MLDKINLLNEKVEALINKYNNQRNTLESKSREVSRLEEENQKCRSEKQEAEQAVDGLTGKLQRLLDENTSESNFQPNFDGSDHDHQNYSNY